MTNLPLRLPHDHASMIGEAIESAEHVAREQLRKLGYTDDTIELELGLAYAHRAAKRGIDLLARAAPKPNGHSL